MTVIPASWILLIHTNDSWWPFHVLVSPHAIIATHFTCSFWHQPWLSLPHITAPLGTLTVFVPSCLLPLSYPEKLSALGLQPDYTKSGLLVISRGTAILLLIVYVAYLFFQVYPIPTHPKTNGIRYWFCGANQLKTHNYLFAAPEDDEQEEAKMSTVAAGSAYVYLSFFLSFFLCIYLFEALFNWSVG